MPWGCCAGEFLPVQDAEVQEVVEVLYVAAAKSDAVLGRIFFGKNRRFSGYIGYTSLHLPVRKDKAPLLNAEDASEASFAARMAFSSFWTRPPLR